MRYHEYETEHDELSLDETLDLCALLNESESLGCPTCGSVDVAAAFVSDDIQSFVCSNNHFYELQAEEKTAKPEVDATCSHCGCDDLIETRVVGAVVQCSVVLCSNNHFYGLVIEQETSGEKK